MTERTLPPFPVDDFTLDQLEHALDARIDGDGEVVGADFTVPRLLDFLSGLDPSRLVPITEDISEYPDAVYTRDCVIRALIAEVRRLRNPSSGAVTA